MSERAPARSEVETVDPSRVIAIDGPVASGKTVVGRDLAKRLGWAMLDTGIMYRALTWWAQEREVDLQDDERLSVIANEVRMEVREPHPDSIETASIYLDSEDVTPHLREHAVEAAVSIVAAVPGVREAMVRAQRQLAAQGRLVMVGRDIGTVVVPNASIKVFLTASDEVRAQRRAAEMRERGLEVEDDEVLRDVQHRDAHDAGRDASPLREAEGSIQLDTTSMDREEVVEAVLALVREHAPEVLSSGA